MTIIVSPSVRKGDIDSFFDRSNSHREVNVMTTELDATQATLQLTKNLSEVFSNGVKKLIEEKHIYQHITIDPQTILSEVCARVSRKEQERFDDIAKQFTESVRFSPSTTEIFITGKGDYTPQTPVPTLLLKNVKIFCPRCDEREIASPIWYSELSNELRKPNMFSFGSIKHHLPANYLPPTFQMFVIVYQCQRREDPPQSFLVRRDGWRLTLDGRSPMEQVDVPTFLPKLEKSLFRDALVAVHGGKVLAGLFYLRTFIEKFARRQTRLAGKITGDEIMSAYADLLPAEHRDHMPSLRHWYDQLSDALHDARDDAQLFETARAEIEKHFDIRRVFKIPETSH